MLVYCGNNPVNRVDPTGCFWNKISDFFRAAASEIGKVMGILSPAYAGCGGVLSRPAAAGFLLVAGNPGNFRRMYGTSGNESCGRLF